MSVKEERETRATRQNEAMDDIADLVLELIDRANKSDYNPTMYEREQLNNISNMIENLKKWF